MQDIFYALELPALYIGCNENLTHCYGKEREGKIKNK